MAKAALEREQLAVWEGGVWGMASGDTPAFERTTKVGRARELLDEIRRRSGETERPEVERDYLNRLLDRF